jgi:osmoprotectant transport system substrate-binding protein
MPQRTLRRTLRQPLTAVLVLALTLLLAACTGTEATGGGGEDVEAGEDTVAGGLDLSGVSLTIGSKDFTEQLVLGQVMSQALTAAGAETELQDGLGSAVIREALTSGQVDAYYEYTGTGWITHLGETTPKPTEEEQFQAVKDADAANNIVWFAPAQANNTYAVAANPQAVEQFNPQTISDYAEIAKTNPEGAALCSATEFITRDDGLPGLAKHYGFPSPKVNEMDFTLVHQQLKAGDVCDFGIVFSTDGLIPVNDEKILEDDKSFFPKYNIAVSMRKDAYDEHAQDYETLFAAIAEKMTDEKMQELNGAVDQEGRDPAEVAKEFLQESGII